MKFLVDGTVSRLGRWLAFAGCDVACDARSARALLRDPAVLCSGRTILGRSPSLATEDLAPGLFLAIRSERLAEQLVEVAQACPDAFPCVAHRGAAAPPEPRAPVSSWEAGAPASSLEGDTPASATEGDNFGSATEGDNFGSATEGIPSRLPAVAALFSRCSRCNEPLEGPLTLEALGADAATACAITASRTMSVPERVRRLGAEFRRCPRCRRVYWEGTHTERIRAALALALALAHRH